MKHTLCDIAVIGAGSAGLFFAFNAAKKGYNIIVLEQNIAAGRKLSISGGGMCNFTNINVAAENYISDKPNTVKNILKGFSSTDFLKLLKEWHWDYEEKERGKIFGLKSANKFTRLIYKKCLDFRVTFFFGFRVSNIYRKERRENTESNTERKDCLFPDYTETFTIAAQDGTEIEAEYLCIACGSPAYPQLGGNDRLLPLLEKWGHTIFPFRPALVPLITEKNWEFGGLSGISLPVEISISAKGNPGQRRFSYCDSLLFTHNGISGPAVLTSSNYYENGDELQLNFLPDCNILSLMEKERNRKKRVFGFLSQYLPNRLAERLGGVLSEKKTAELNKKERKELEKRVHHYSVLPIGTESFSLAETARGGIAMENVNSKLESRIVHKLFFCGEILNVTGMLGGYNLHWAFASAKAAVLNLEDKSPRPISLNSLDF